MPGIALSALYTNTCVYIYINIFTYINAQGMGSAPRSTNKAGTVEGLYPVEE